MLNKIAIFDQPLDRQITEIVREVKNLDSLSARISGLETYADNTAALAGGLTAGQLYKTATGAVMVVY